MTFPGWVRGLDGSGTQPGNHRLGVHLWIQMSYTLPGPLPHPLPVIPNVLRQTLRPPPLLQTRLRPAPGIDRGPPRKPGRDLHHPLRYQNCDRIQVTPVRRQPQPLGLQRATPPPPQRDLICWATFPRTKPGSRPGPRPTPPRRCCFPTPPAAPKFQTAVCAPAFDPPSSETGPGGQTGRPPKTTTARPAPPPRGVSPTTGAGWTGGRAGWTSHGPTPG